METSFHFKRNISISSCSVKSICQLFAKLLPMILSELFKQILKEFAEEQMKSEKKSFSCNKCANNKDFTWKTHKAKETKIITIWGTITINQMQVLCKCCSKKMFITRHLLEMKKRQRVPDFISKQLALIGALCSFRVAEKLLSTVGASLSKVTVWRCLQKEASQIKFTLDPAELPAGEADGTGIRINKIKKRGRELKVFVQKKIGGGIRIAGLGIGKYKGGWDKVFAPSLAIFEEFKETFFLLTDGDTDILKGLDIDVIYQRCLFHIPHQLKHTLWEDGVKHKSKLWRNLMAKTILLSTLPNSLNMEQSLIDSVLKIKNKDFDDIIELCEKHNFTRCLSYLNNARPDMFTSFSNKLEGKTTSLVERVMRTVNLRTNVGKWSEQGALNVCRIRLGHYYNGLFADCSLNKMYEDDAVISVEKLAS